MMEGFMHPTLAVLLLWLGFAGTHLTLSSVPVRKRIVDGIGESAFRGLYSLIAFAFFVPLVWTYFANKHTGPWLWQLPPGPLLRWGIYLGMGLALVLLVASLLNPSPASVVPGDATPRGAFRITRHPLLMSLGIFGLVHLLPNGSATDVAFFLGFPVFAVVGAWHQDQRKLQTQAPGFADFYQGTPFFPFTGSGTLQAFRELSPLALVAGIGLTIVIRYFHVSWFGG
jgi:uncharacterized membrane protein